MILHCGNYNSQMSLARFFEEYILPYFQPIAERPHHRGKALACHADADTSLLHGLIREAGFDMIDCLVTEPMVPVGLADVRAAFGTEVIV